MSKKKSEIVVSHQPVSIEYVVDEIKKRTSLENVIASSPVQSLATGSDGNLSTNQHALVATVVSVMQDDLIGLAKDQVETLREELREQRSFVTDIVGRTTTGLILGLRNGWAMPLVSEDPVDVTEATPPTVWDRVKAFLNWGNFVTAAGVLVLGVALYYTKTYSSLKDRVENQSKYVTELEAQGKRDQTELKARQTKIDDLDTQLTEAKSNSAVDRARYETAQQQLSTQTGSTSDLQTQLNSSQAKVADLSAKAAAAEAKLSAAQNDVATFRKLYDDDQKQLSKVEDNASTMNKENQRLALALQACKPKK